MVKLLLCFLSCCYYELSTDSGRGRGKDILEGKVVVNEKWILQF